MNHKLIDLIRSAQGNRSQTKFAIACNLNPATISRAYTGQTNLRIETLKRIAENSEGKITFEDLMVAAGYDLSKPQNLDGLYLRLAREAANLCLDEEDVSYMLNFFKKREKKNPKLDAQFTSNHTKPCRAKPRPARPCRARPSQAHLINCFRPR